MFFQLFSENEKLIGCHLTLDTVRGDLICSGFAEQGLGRRWKEYLRASHLTDRTSKYTPMTTTTIRSPVSTTPLKDYLFLWLHPTNLNKQGLWEHLLLEGTGAPSSKFIRILIRNVSECQKWVSGINYLTHMTHIYTYTGSCSDRK
jgi:hypothetical protein